jgi:hypothetical protein
MAHFSAAAVMAVSFSWQHVEQRVGLLAFLGDVGSHAFPSIHPAPPR